MPIDRKDWISPFNHLPRWLCPRCRTGHLVAKSPDATKGEETRASRINRANPDVSPEWYEHRFATLIHCNNAACAEVVSVTGWRETFEDCMPDRDGNYWTERVRIDSVLPPPVPIHIPENVPVRIRKPIERAARLYWTSAAAAGNSLRQAAERYLDHKGVKKYRDQSRKSVFSLGERTALFEKRFKSDTTFLTAIRWLGNIASHEGDIDRNHILTAFEMIELVLEDDFVGHARRLMKEAQTIVRTRGKAKPAKA
jgi:transposase